MREQEIMNAGMDRLYELFQCEVDELFEYTPKEREGK